MPSVQAWWQMGQKGSVERARPTQNLCGPIIRRLRSLRGWTQLAFAAKCQIAGLEFSREIVARIEGRDRGLRDVEIARIASIFGVEVGELFPRRSQKRR